ncbi:hypothetical protein QVD17_20052 [Tagetes erecta]|uniref:Ubiquitin-like protease family profile domain-containing protein n=1 Tax=Tagetes erecta TaxID=13708 RepID=A0AAD8KKK3_TARER|nr:hypothetical protein QVD17_20052 [Tagetes erecta]
MEPPSLMNAPSSPAKRTSEPSTSKILSTEQLSSETVHVSEIEEQALKSSKISKKDQKKKEIHTTIGTRGQRQSQRLKANWKSKFTNVESCPVIIDDQDTDMQCNEGTHVVDKDDINQTLKQLVSKVKSKKKMKVSEKQVSNMRNKKLCLKKTQSLQSRNEVEEVLYLYQKEKLKNIKSFVKKPKMLQMFDYTAAVECEEKLFMSMSKTKDKIKSLKNKGVKQDTKKQSLKIRLKKPKEKEKEVVIGAEDADGTSEDDTTVDLDKNIENQIADQIAEIVKSTVTEVQLRANMLEKELSLFDDHATKMHSLLIKAKKDFPGSQLIEEKERKWLLLLNKYNTIEKQQSERIPNDAAGTEKNVFQNTPFDVTDTFMTEYEKYEERATSKKDYFSDPTSLDWIVEKDTLKRGPESQVVEKDTMDVDTMAKDTTKEKAESTKNKFCFSDAPTFDLQIPDLTPSTQEGQENIIVEEVTMGGEKTNEEDTMKKGTENTIVFKGGYENPNVEKETEQVLREVVDTLKGDKTSEDKLIVENLIVEKDTLKRGPKSQVVEKGTMDVDSVAKDTTKENAESTKNKFCFSDAPTFDLQIPDLTQSTQEGQENMIVEEETVGREMKNQEDTMKKGSENTMVFIGGPENPNVEKETEQVLKHNEVVDTIDVQRRETNLNNEKDEYITPVKDIIICAEPVTSVKPELEKKKRPEREKFLPEKMEPLFYISSVITVPRVIMESLRPGIEIHADIISAWAHILNYEEKKRSRESVYRLFCTTPMIKEAFVGYLDSISHPKATKMKQTVIDRLKMNWRTTTNVIDCGIFTMRHMETFMGQEAADWKCGFGKEEAGNQQVQLEDLRRKYTAKILLHDINENKHLVTKTVKKYMELTANDKRKIQRSAKQRIESRLKLNID